MHKLIITAMLWTTLTSAQDAALPVIDMHVHAPVADSTRASFIARMRANNVVAAAWISLVSEVLAHRAEGVELIPSWNLTRILSPDSLPDPAWLRAEIQAGRIRMLGEVSAQYYNIRPDDPMLEPYFALAESLDVPVGIHLGFAPPGEPYRRPYRLAAGNPYHLEGVLAKHPHLRLYVMHAGFPLGQEMLGLMLIYPQVYVDISAINTPRALPVEAFHDYLALFVRAGLTDRIMFGSDVTTQLSQAIAAINSAPFLSAQQKRDILYNNAARFLRLSPAVSEGHHRAVSGPR